MPFNYRTHHNYYRTIVILIRCNQGKSHFRRHEDRSTALHFYLFYGLMKKSTPSVSINKQDKVYLAMLKSFLPQEEERIDT